MDPVILDNLLIKAKEHIGQKASFKIADSNKLLPLEGTVDCCWIAPEAEMVLCSFKEHKIIVNYLILQF